jgi:hypothetical protein
MTITFDQSVLNQGDPVTATIDTGGQFLLESDLFQSSAQIDPQPGDHIEFGPAQIGAFAVRLSSSDDLTFFYAWLTILPQDGQLTLAHFDFAPPASLEFQQFSNDVFSKFIGNLTGDRLLSALKEAAAAFPADAVTAIGTTAVLAAVFFPEATPLFFIGSATGLAVQFLSRINDSLIDGMIADNSLETDEGNFLKLLWGFRALAGNVFSLFEEPEAIEQVKTAIETVDTVKDLATPAGELSFGVRIQSSNSIAPKSVVVIHLNDLP